MTDTREPEGGKLSLSKPKKLEIKKTVDAGQVRQSFSHGRSKTVAVEIKKKRAVGAPAVAEKPVPAPAPTPRRVLPPAALAPTPQPMPRSLPEPVVEAKPEVVEAPVAAAPPPPPPPPEVVAPVEVAPPPPPPPVAAPAAPVAAPPAAAPRAPAASAAAARPTAKAVPPRGAARAAPPAPPPPQSAPQQRTTDVRRARPGIMLKALTDDEKESRARALEGARQADVEARLRAEVEAGRRAEEQARLQSERDASAKRAAVEEERKRTDEETKRKAEEQAAKRLVEDGTEDATAGDADKGLIKKVGTGARPDRRPPVRRERDAPRRRAGKLTMAQALDESERVRSLASVRRAREREKRLAAMGGDSPSKVLRDVVVPETITVQELANRMAERAVDVIKTLMTMGVMATINEVIDADTAELVVTEFGHRFKRVSESDVEIGLRGAVDEDTERVSRPPVVTIMGHVDHGKTSLLDAIRQTDVVSGEAGGITQHIGAYQIETTAGRRITFIDTPGHEAFTSMRARGAQVTDIVVLVVAADDGIMPQTVEAINHAKAAQVPLIVAINKIDKPEANAQRVRQELLNHGLVDESLGGDVLSVEVSATKKTNLDKLEEAILLQAEVLDLRANPNRPAEGVVIEAKLDRGRGAVATVLVQRGTLKVGDIIVAGSEWGRVRALVDDHGKRIDTAEPSLPVEVLGLANVPVAGDEFVVVENESRAREVTQFRVDRGRKARAASTGRSTLEQMFSDIKEGTARELPVVVKADVHGSLEAILAALEKLKSQEVAIRVLHSAVGGVNESDVTLAKASNALIIGFNVRADAVARDLARQQGTEIRYYSIIYELTDQLRGMLSGMLSPELREKVIGQAQVLEVFGVSKVGRIAGCRIVDGIARRTARARIVRDNVVVFNGKVGSLRRFKEDVREVTNGNECGIGLEGYQDIQPGDTIELYEVEERARVF